MKRLRKKVTAMRICKTCKWADIAKYPRTIIISPTIKLTQHCGCIICTKPTVNQLSRGDDGEWICSDYEPRQKKVRKG